MKDRIRDRLHPKQIPTKAYAVKRQLWELGFKAIYSLLYCLSSEPGSFEQKNHMILAAILFERISCPVYIGKDGYPRKPPASKYYHEIFEGWAETPKEIYDRIGSRGVTLERAERIHKLVWQIADLVCPMMACDDEQMFVGEYAYAIEYVIRHGGDLPKPEIKHVFPQNYPDYDYMKGIAEEIGGYEEYCL